MNKKNILSYYTFLKSTKWLSLLINTELALCFGKGHYAESSYLAAFARNRFVRFYCISMDKKSYDLRLIKKETYLMNDR